MLKALAQLCEDSPYLDRDAMLHRLLAVFVTQTQARRGALLLFDAGGEPAALLSQGPRGGTLATALVTHAEAEQASTALGETVQLYPIGSASQPPLALLALEAAVPTLPEALEQGLALITPLVALAQSQPSAQQESKTESEASPLRSPSQAPETPTFNRALVDAAALLSSSLDLEAVLDQILIQLERVVPYEASNVMLIENGKVRPRRWRGYERFGVTHHFKGLEFSATLPTIQRLIKEQKPLLIPDTRHSPLWVDMPSSSWVRSYAAAPIVVEDEILGFVSVDSARANTYTEQDTQQLATFAHYAAIALKNARLFTESEQRQHYLEQLNRVATLVNSDEDLDTILHSGLEAVLAISGMEAGRLYLREPHTERVTLHARLGLPSDFDPNCERSCFEDPAGIIKGDQECLSELPYQTPLPLEISGRRVGIIYLNHPKPVELASETRQLLQAVAHQLAVAVHRRELSEALRTQLQAVYYLYEVSASLVGHVNSAGVAFLLLRVLKDSLPYALSTALYQHDGKTWRRSKVYLPGKSPLPMPVWEKGEPWEGEVALLERCRIQEQWVSVTEDSAELPSFWEDQIPPEVKQLLYLPLHSPQDGYLGVVAVALGAKLEPSPPETAMAQAYLQQSAAALARIRLYERSREEEGRLRAILESSEDGIILVAEGRDIRYVNERALQLLRLGDDRAAWEARALSEAVPRIRGIAPQLADYLEETALQAPFTPPIEEAPPLFETQPGHTLVLHRQPVATDRQEPVGELFLFRDITERIALERMRDDLLHMLVHDLRNPLSVIINALQILEDPSLQDIGPEAMELAMSNAEQMLTLVNAILDIGQLETRRLKYQPQAVSLISLLEPLDQYMALRRCALELEFELPPDLPQVAIEPLLIQRVFRNLLDNALKFCPTEGGRVRIMARRQGEWIEVECYNNGPPIPPEIEADLFEKFGKTEYRGQGYGLGLAFCRLAVEAHGGQIRAENQPQGGVSFFFTLPVAEES